ncbi:uncharacterized protein LOC116188010 isoform X2 [Punica granatum]|uniref:Uncharacterized protein LOC116188010 isoform X2 n=1 Tax=Punica granatum TaxID=22663 RepID=A0A6P8BQF9_PUNGR|nr:uncharacterized protein LOC116188010 isoform X2 [Punica granatum]
MASDAQRQHEQQQEPNPTMQIYSTTSNMVSPFWREKYEREAKKYWDIFFKRHQDKFFKDRHYLDKEWGRYFSVGCGAGNTIFPLVATYPDIFVHACDFSPRAVNLVKLHKDFTDSRISAFVCDLTADDLIEHVPPSSVDIVTMIFVLSAVSPEKMPFVLQNIRKVLKPNGHVLFRDYATGDLAQERFSIKDQMISENFYVRGDGTRAFYFSNDFLADLFKDNWFDVEELGLCCKQVENRSRELVMNRRWVQAVFRLLDFGHPTGTDAGNEVEPCIQENNGLNSENTMRVPVDDSEIDMSEGIAFSMFGVPPTDNEIIDVNLKDDSFKIRVLSKEYQHTCKSTGLMLWESAYLMASILSRNLNIVSGKRVLELGCGCGGICSMVAARSADLVIASDGDPKALDLLTDNISSNLRPPLVNKLSTKRLEWGNMEHIEAIKAENQKGFEVIIGTDVTYVPEAILPLFATAKELIATNCVLGENEASALILCHVFRRVDEPSIVSAASRYGFRLVDRWPSGISGDSSESIIWSWFPKDGNEVCNFSTALNIMYFQVE